MLYGRGSRLAASIGRVLLGGYTARETQPQGAGQNLYRAGRVTVPGIYAEIRESRLKALEKWNS